MSTPSTPSRRPAPAPPAGEFALTAQDFSRICQLIHQRAGIALGAHKRHLVYSRLSRRLRELGLADFASYLRLLEADAQGLVWRLRQADPRGRPELWAPPSAAQAR